MTKYLRYFGVLFFLAEVGVGVVALDSYSDPRVVTARYFFVVGDDYTTV